MSPCFCGRAQKEASKRVRMQRKHIRGMTSEPVSSSRRSKIGLTLALQRDVVLFFLSSSGKGRERLHCWGICCATLR